MNISPGNSFSAFSGPPRAAGSVSVVSNRAGAKVNASAEAGGVAAVPGIISVADRGATKAADSESANSSFKPVADVARSSAAGDTRQVPAVGTEGVDPSRDQPAAATAREQRQIEEQIETLAARDREVRAHEQAHVAAGGQYAGAPVYQYERGPNGRSYAVGGEVPISTGEEASPAETLRKAQIIRRAALAPAEPSPQDRRVAAMASQMEARARNEIAVESAQEQEASAVEDAQSGNSTKETTSENRSATPEVGENGWSETPARPAAGGQAGFESSSDNLLSSARRQEASERLQQKLVTLDQLQRPARGSLFSHMA